MMKHSKLITACIVPLALLVCFSAMADTPATINIRGQLLNASGQALTGARAFSVQFFDAPSGGNPVGAAITGSVDVSTEGIFNIETALPPGALLLADVWYEMAISSSATPGPLTASDVFPNRVKVVSVPFAQKSAIADNVTHVEVSAIGSGTILDSEFDFLAGLTGNIQDQLDTKANAANVYTISEVNAALAGKMDAAAGYTKAEVDLMQDAQDAIIDEKADTASVYTKTEVNSALAPKANSADVVAKAGDTMTGALSVNNSFISIGQSTAPSPVTDKLYNVGGKLKWNGALAYQFPWTSVSASTQMAANTGYIVSSNTEMITVTLPPSTSLNVGDTIRVNGLGAAGWKIAQNASQTILLDSLQIPNYAATWKPSLTDANRNWCGVASSSDGSKLLAVGEGFLYTSSDSGITWTLRQSGQDWYSAAVSGDGTIMMTGVYGGRLWRSVDSGVTWNEIMTSPPGVSVWSSIDISANGATIVATNAGEFLTISKDNGATWTRVTIYEFDPEAMPPSFWDAALSADGTTMLTGQSVGGYVWLSQDAGATWTPRFTDNLRDWTIPAMSADGRKMIVTEYWSHHYTSSDFGATWLDHVYQGNRYWGSLGASSDLNNLVASDANGSLYASTNGGATWEVCESANRNWGSVAMSANGERCWVTTYEGYLYSCTNVGTRAATTAGVGGYLAGGKGTAVELQYMGNDTFYPLSHEGPLGAN